jgi:hypothetical protein
MTAGVQILRSNVALGDLQTWLAGTGAGHAGSPFPAKLGAFRQFLATHNVIPTGEAVRVLAQGQGFNYDAWCVAQLALVSGGPTEFILPKLDEGAACWNWALTACTPTPAPTPNEVFDWLHQAPPPPGAVDPHMPAFIAGIAGGPLLAAKNDLIATKNLMNQSNLAVRANNYDPNWVNDAAQVNRVRALTERAAANIVKLHGFQVVVPAAGHAVVIEHKIADGVSWEHWWIEYNNVVVETFPSMKFVMNMTNQRQVDRMTAAQRAQYAVYRISVADLKADHHDKVRTGLAQHL